MRKSLSYIFILFFIPVLFAVSGCKSKQTTLKPTGKLDKKSMESLLESVKKNEINYRTLECKGKIELRKGNSQQKTNAVFKLVKDSIMQVSVRIPIFGGEAIRLTFTPDEVIMIDRLSKQYAHVKYKKLGFLDKSSDKLFYNLQAIFTNQLFLPGKTKVTSKDYNLFDMSATADVYMLQTQTQNKNFSINFAVDASDRIVSTLIYNANKSGTLQWSYRDFVQDSQNNAIYPTQMDAKIQLGTKRIDIGIECPQLDIDNKNFNINNSIPQKYTKVDIDDIINKYTGKL